MSRHSRGLRVAIIGLWLAGVGGGAAVAQTGPVEPLAAAPTSAPPDDVSVLDTVEVTARRRVERLEDTPVSVTALTREDLRAAGVMRLDQIQEYVPSLSIARDQVGRPEFFIRGVGTPPGLLPGFAFDPGVGIYLDGVYLPRASGRVLDLVDVEQIEVLRGPQGTLFGKNTVGGAVNITTAKPRDDYEGFFMVRPGNFGSVDTRMMLNAPIRVGALTDRLFARVAFGTTNRQGYVENSFRDETLSNANSMTFLGTLSFVPTDGLVFDLSGTWERSHQRQRGGECVYRTNGGFGALVPPNPETGETFFDACRASRPFDVQSDVPSLIEQENWGTWLKSEWDVGSLGPVDVSVRSLTAWQEQQQRARVDIDMTGFFLARQSEAGGGLGNGGPRHQRQVSEELQINGRALQDRLSVVGGLFTLWEEGDLDADIWALPQVVDIRAKNRIGIDNWSWALFSQATYDATDWISLTGGVRYTQEQKEADFWWTTPFGNPKPLFDESADSTDGAWTPMASIALTMPKAYLQRTFLDHTMAYFTYARGFRGGGFDAIITPTQPQGISSVDPEHIDSYEIGVKTIAANQRLVFNTSLYTTQYTDLQVQSIVGSTNVFNPRTVVLNAGQARIRGLEIETSALPFGGLRIEGSLSVLHARYEEFDSISAATGLPIDRAGEKLPYVPDVQARIAVQYTFPISIDSPGWLRGRLTPRFEWYRQDDVMYVAPEVPQGTQAGYDLFNARLSYVFLQERAQVALWARNLTNEAYFDFAFNLLPAGTLTRYYQAPRTFGAEMSYRF